MANIRSVIVTRFLPSVKKKLQVFCEESETSCAWCPKIRLPIGAMVHNHRMSHLSTGEDMKFSADLTETSLQMSHAHIHYAMTDDSNCGVSNFYILTRVSVE